MATDPNAGVIGALCRPAENALLDHLHGTAYTPASAVYLALSVALSVVNSSYQWTASANGTAEYFLEAAAGGDPGLEDPEIMLENGAEMVRGTAGSLAAGDFDFAENDGQGGPRVYVRLSDGADPDSKADGFLLAGANPGNDGAGLNEPADTYARQVIGFNAAASRQVAQASDLLFSTAGAAWGWVTHWAVCDSSTGGNVLAKGRFNAAQYVNAGMAPKIYAGAVWLRLQASAGGQGITDYCANKLLDLVFRAQGFAIAGVALALLSASAGDTDEDISTDCSEMAGTGYSRISVNPAGGSAPAWSAAASGQVTNADKIDWGSPGADDWGTLTGIALVSDGGKVLGYDNNISDFTPTTSDSVQIDAGASLFALH